jgi:hypothetical protein
MCNNTGDNTGTWGPMAKQDTFGIWLANIAPTYGAVSVNSRRYMGDPVTGYRTFLQCWTVDGNHGTQGAKFREAEAFLVEEKKAGLPVGWFDTCNFRIGTYTKLDSLPQSQTQTFTVTGYGYFLADTFYIKTKDGINGSWSNNILTRDDDTTAHVSLSFNYAVGDTVYMRYLGIMETKGDSVDTHFRIGNKNTDYTTSGLINYWNDSGRVDGVITTDMIDRMGNFNIPVYSSLRPTSASGMVTFFGAQVFYNGGTPPLGVTWTIGFPVYIVDTITAQCLYEERDGSSNYTSFIIKTGVLNAFNSSGGVACNLPAGLKNVWTYLTFESDGSIYINGVLQGHFSTNATGIPSGHEIQIGAVAGANLVVNGTKEKYWMVWDVLLSGANVLQNYSNFKLQLGL